MTVDNYIAYVKPAAQTLYRKYGILPIVSIAHSANETGWGEHAPGSNYFGIKAGSSWAGPVSSLQTQEFENGKYITITSKFRAYNSVEESFLDYGKLVATNSRYAKAIAAVKDPIKYFTELMAAGYGTDPNYVSKMVKIMDQIRSKVNVLGISVFWIAMIAMVGVGILLTNKG